MHDGKATLSRDLIGARPLWNPRNNYLDDLNHDGLPDIDTARSNATNSIFIQRN